MFRQLAEDWRALWHDADVFERVVLAACTPAWLVAWLIVFVFFDLAD